MKFPTQRTRQQYQSLLDNQTRLRTELRQLETQIQQFQSAYFQKHFNEGNIVLGWPKVAGPSPPHNAPKIKLISKDKPFSMSSVTSRVNFQLDDIADKNLTPYPQNRFMNMKKNGRKGAKKGLNGLNNLNGSHSHGHGHGHHHQNQNNENHNSNASNHANRKKIIRRRRR